MSYRILRESELGQGHCNITASLFPAQAYQPYLVARRHLTSSSFSENDTANSEEKEQLFWGLQICVALAAAD